MRVFDGHNDTLLELHVDERGGGQSFFERSDAGHIDLPRAHAAEYGGSLFAVFVPNEGASDGAYDRRQTADGYEIPLADPVDHTRAKRVTYEMLERLYRLERQARERADGGFRVARSVTDIQDCLDSGAVAAVPHLEGAAAVAPDLSNLEFLYAAGVRSIGLVWSRPNAFGEGVPFRYPATPDIGDGLTDAGRALVRACENRGIVVDCAHLNQAGFEDVHALTDAPLVVSHAAAHAVCPSARTLTDDQLRAIADSNGVVGLSFATSTLRPDGEDDPETPLSTLVAHIDHIVDVAGIDHVALGSDFDGAGVPNSIGDVTGVPPLLDALRERGYSENDVRAIARENWLRVLAAWWS
ncbi:peptidase [Halobaculum sp. WSA2]|uniref:Peptidase n=1 Tax=Halobaculum saliterrae TaxID=2073113 RepID=A0A6B0SQ45_9EURY|nr:dipeptidase [Halobaculum saliterrae]MXR40795.1 peptidase [Halobaculum saliterrae]